MLLKERIITDYNPVINRSFSFPLSPINESFSRVLEVQLSKLEEK